jgi:hypothetical protein
VQPGVLLNELKDAAALALNHAPGIRSSELKQKQAGAYMDMALSCVRVLLRVQAEKMKQAQVELPRH